MGKINFSRQISKVFADQRKKGKQVIAIAMNKTIKEVKEMMQDEMKKIFDNPTPFVLNSFWLKFASEQTLVVSIEIKDKFGSGATEVISPHIEGGTRKIKSSEWRLREKGHLASNKYITPGSGVRLNKYGNIPGPKMVQILSATSSFLYSGSDLNKTRDSTKKNPNQDKYFVIKDNSNSHLKPGVYYRSGKGGKKIKPILIFASTPHYNKTFFFFELAEQFYREKLTKNIAYAHNKVYSKGTP